MKDQAHAGEVLDGAQHRRGHARGGRHWPPAAPPSWSGAPPVRSPRRSRPAPTGRCGRTRPGSLTAAVWAAVPEPNTMPPAVGRTKVCTVSLTESRAGILSATISTASRTATIAITQPFSSQAQPVRQGDQAGEPGQQAHQQHGDVGVKPGGGRQAETGHQFHAGSPAADPGLTIWASTSSGLSRVPRPGLRPPTAPARG